MYSFGQFGKSVRSSTAPPKLVKNMLAGDCVGCEDVRQEAYKRRVAAYEAQRPRPTKTYGPL